MATIFFFLLFLALGIAAYVASRRSRFVTDKSGAVHERIEARVTRIGYPILLVLALLVLAFGSFVTIEPGQVGVQVLFGSVQPEVLESGFHAINPLLNIVHLDARTQAYTMSAKEDEGQVKGDDAIQVLSADGLTLTLEVTVQYHLSPASAPKVYSTVGLDYVEKVVRPEIRSSLRDAAVSFLATDLYSAKRGEFTQLVKNKMLAAFKDRGIVLEGVLLRDILLPEKVRSAIDEKIAAEQESQKMQYILQREKQEADRKRVEAAGISDAQKIIAGSLTNQYLQYNYISTLKELVNSKNSTFVITPFDQKLTPMLNMGPK